MFQRKLKALGYHHSDSFCTDDEMQYRTFIVWLEDKKIRLLKVEDRSLLRNIKSTDWPAAFESYLKDLQCPIDHNDRTYVTAWLLSHVVKLEYSHSAENFNEQHKERTQRKQPAVSTNCSADSGSLCEITSDNPDLKAGVASLSKLLSIPSHHDHIMLLQAIRSLVEERLTDEMLYASKKQSTDKSKDKSTDGDFLPLNEVDLGFATNDPAVNEAGKILRLLHLHELRDLQTKINKAIVAVQASTANPKTDQSLGKVGR